MMSYGGDANISTVVVHPPDAQASPCWVALSLSGICALTSVLLVLVTTNVGAATVWSASAWPVVGTRRSDR